MFRTLAVLVLLMQAAAFGACAQGRIEPEPLPPLPPAPPAYGTPPGRFDPPRGVSPALPAFPPATASEPPSLSDEPRAGERVGSEGARVFCDQSVSYRLAGREGTPEPFRPFVGIWSDASWTPQVCAALIVEKVGSDGLASIIYAFGPMGSNARVKGGVLHGTGIVRDGELRFQNSDGSQYAFRRLYADLEGSFTTPQGQTYQAIFKKTF